MMDDTNPRLRDILLLFIFAVLLRFAEVWDKDEPGWWLEESSRDD